MSTRYQGTPEEVAALDLYMKLMKAARSVSWKLGSQLENHGLTLPQLGVLDILFHLGSMPEHELRPKLLGLGMNVDELLERMEQLALIRRVRQPEERRTVLVFLTDRGREMMDEVFPRHVRNLVSCMQVLSLEEQEKLGEMCRKLGLHAGA